ncbi:hypothetical protein L6R52_10175 [Myxococcota bacterium]|nr:hypothetical protein [Myxococcota bacterium]
MSDLEVGLQRALENIYRIEENASVADFRIDVELLESVLGSGARDTHRETLLVQEEGEHVDLALYIAEEVVGRARSFARDAGEALDHLDAFCVATEGVSHFVYVLFCGARERPVSHTELELQAEIDKFVVLRVLFELSGSALLERLYDHFQLAERLSHHERERYTVANRAGRRYARWLEREFARGRTAKALDDARALYRKPLAGKLEHIARAA